MWHSLTWWNQFSLFWLMLGWVTWLLLIALEPSCNRLLQWASQNGYCPELSEPEEPPLKRYLLGCPVLLLLWPFAWSTLLYYGYCRFKHRKE